ncbi:MAG: hypothetical protein K2X47_19850 [Bdellovibrionales bacterium]|nr:hypothetical protein [Bdellovibrionales bacterium]
MIKIQGHAVSMGLALILLACGQKIEFQQTTPMAPIVGQEGQAQVGVTPEESLYVRKSETFFQSTEDPRVDILFVNDNSLSMYSEQTEMAKRFSAFTSVLADIDWQIAMTTTDVSDGRFGMKGRFLRYGGPGSQTILTRDTPQYDRMFAETITRQETFDCSINPSADTCPSGDEKPLVATMLAMDLASTENARFFRKKSSLAVVALSDEDENSNGSGSVAPEAVLGRFLTYWPTGKNFAFYGIVVEPDDTVCLEKQNKESASYYGKSVSALARLTGGITGSICSDDYSEVLSRIAWSVRNLVAGVDLERVPEVGTVHVDFDPVQDISYTLAGRKVIFDRAPQKGSKISITYIYKKAIEVANLPTPQSEAPGRHSRVVSPTADK